MSGARPWKGIDADVLREAGVYTGNDGRVRVPYRYGDGTAHRERVVATSGKKWWGPGEGQIMFGLETIPDDTTDWSLILCEGESDTLAIREAYSVTNDVCVLGLPGALSWQPEWLLIAQGFVVIYLVADGDDAGRKMIEKVRADVPWARPVFLPDGEDARSLLQRDGNRALDPYLAGADSDARLYVAMKLARTIDECEALLRGEEVQL